MNPIVSVFPPLGGVCFSPPPPFFPCPLSTLSLTIAPLLCMSPSPDNNFCDVLCTNYVWGLLHPHGLLSCMGLTRTQVFCVYPVIGSRVLGLFFGNTSPKRFYSLLVLFVVRSMPPPFLRPPRKSFRFLEHRGNRPPLPGFCNGGLFPYSHVFLRKGALWSLPPP